MFDFRLMTPFERHLTAASGFLELGLPLDANEELEQIEPEMRSLSEVFVVRLGIYRALEKWELVETLARRLCELRPDEPQWFIALAYALRHLAGFQEALAVLAHAANRFPDEPMLLYNLACYACQLGHLHSAKARLGEAIKLAPSCRDMARKDEDLKPLWNELREGRF